MGSFTCAAQVAAKVQQVKDFAAQLGLSLDSSDVESREVSHSTADVGRLKFSSPAHGCVCCVLCATKQQFVQALRSWGDFTSVAAWRGPDGVLTQLSSSEGGGGLGRCVFQHSRLSCFLPCAFDSATSWRRTSGSIYFLCALRSHRFVSHSKRQALLDWASMLRSKVR